MKFPVENNVFALETVFVPHPDAKVRKISNYRWIVNNLYLPHWLILQSEDDGMLLSSLVFGGNNKKRTGLLVLDAATFKEIGRK
jgi:carotenoid cleavage dioxygenase-like enzyme